MDKLNEIKNWFDDSFREYMLINWKHFSDRDKDVALSLKASFYMDMPRLVSKLDE